MTRKLHTTHLRSIVLLVSLLFCQNISAKYLIKLNAERQIVAEWQDDKGVITGDLEFTEAMRSSLPASFGEVVFDAAGVPIMDEIFWFYDLSTIIPDFPYEFEVYHWFQKQDGIYVEMENEQVSTRNFVLNNVAGKHLYFTGTCTEAYAGTTDSEAVFYLQGNEGETVDVYLHDFNMKVQDKALGKMNINHVFSSFIKGSNASVFAVGSAGENTAAAFTANFHICGDNTLTGGNISKLDGSEGGIMTVLADIMTVISSPIAIRPIANTADEYENRAVRLLFDDVVPQWGVPTRVNGSLNLPLEGNRSTPSIDLGNRNGYCEFNGGQYRFATPASNSMFYVCSMAICYKQLSFMGATFYGVGSSVGTSTTELNENRVRVRIKDGTFTTYSAEDYRQTVDVVARGWYQSYTDLRLPYESRIDGGTFNNCRVYRCDASAERGSSPVNSPVNSSADSKPVLLCYKELTVTKGENSNGTLSPAQVAAVPELAAAKSYGTESLTPVLENDEYKLRAYLPLLDCGEEPITKTYMHNWVTVIPKMGLDSFLTMGGNVYAQAFESDSITPRTNAYLFYARLNDYTKKYASVDIGLTATVEQAIRLGGGPEFSSVTNPNAYKIAHGLYTMLSFETNRWYTLSMPYDVANIYTLETSEYQKGKHPEYGQDETLEHFLKRQGEDDGNLASTIITSLCPDIFSGKGSGVLMNLVDIAKQQLNRTPIPLIYYNPARDGHTAKEANFYLYEQKGDGETDEFTKQPYWNFSTNADDYSPKWQLVEPDTFPNGKYQTHDGDSVPAGEILMKKGHNYCIFLPDGEDTRYWDGKYLIFEGYGPQEINGSDARNYDEANADNAWTQSFVDDGWSLLFGNATFANDTTTEAVYVPVWRNKDYVFEKRDALHAILPCESYIVLSENNTEVVDAITREGKPIVRQQNGTNGDTFANLPCISDISLLATATDGNILLRAYAEQRVSIYTVDGRLLYAATLHDGTVQHIPAQAGVYLICGEQQTKKLMVP